MKSVRILASLAVMIPVIAQADNLTGTDRFLCASSRVVRCYSIGDCESGPPWEWNMPSFIQVDLKKKLLSTPAASAEQRRSPLTHLVREAGQIIVQGTENGRALSMVIDEETGQVSMAIALDGITINVFGACTPEP
ncbi:MAG: hypothetical protein E4H19_08890 [Chromatiales bacterium]|jgi:hypothetical protein|nr:MAG: hypothetical protein E4H19_08890 [Chromatiales bacterium]